MPLTSDCFECVTEDEYKAFVECWFDDDFSCGENVKAELRSAYLLIKSNLTDYCYCGSLCSDEVKEAVYTQCYYANNYMYDNGDDTTNYQLTPEAYNYCVSKGLFSA